MASSYFMLRFLRKQYNANNFNEEKKSKCETISKINKTDLKCRVCLKEGCIPIFGNDVNYPDVSRDIRIFGNIEITKNDDYPKYLCDACDSLLKSAVLFRKYATETNEILRQSTLPSSQSPIDEHFSTDVFNHENKILNETEISPPVYDCKLCNIKFKSYEKYVKHKNSKKHKNTRIQCPICYGLLTSQLYKRHLARHQSASHLICEVCGKLYRKDNLVRHLQLHSFELPFQCTQCPYRGRFLESLKIHVRTHTGIKPFSCTICQLRFLTRSNLNRHLLTHKKDKPYKCNECGRGFYSKGDVEMHFKSDHAGIKDFACRLCGSKYGTRKALMRHELRVHKRDKMAKGRMPLYLQDEYKT